MRFFKSGGLAGALAVLFVMLTGFSLGPSSAQVEEEFSKIFPNVQIERVEESPVKGLWEIYSRGEMLYYSPKEEVLIFGEIWSSDGRSLTQAKLAQIAAEEEGKHPMQLGELSGKDLEGGIVLGRGGPEVIAFISPTCPACKQAWAWMDSTDFKSFRVRFFFTPMAEGGYAYNRAKAVVCASAENRRNALRDLYDSEELPDVTSCPGADNVLATHARLAEEQGVRGTPTFLVGNQAILGFQRSRLEKLLSLDITKED